MGKELDYFFMNPCEKYKAKSKIPYKLIIQLLKLTLVLIAVSIQFLYFILICFNGFFKYNSFKSVKLLN